jgi:hypothetical protein
MGQKMQSEKDRAHKRGEGSGRSHVQEEKKKKAAKTLKRNANRTITSTTPSKPRARFKKIAGNRVTSLLSRFLT